ncbi:unnamed protein product [Orchesella dallaii]|uniref:C2H2-type domain-containing protein n=1 Tax=Orchesella dallaii TaxID=48710 RepID=A0ABP1R246_9HEXA
MSTNAIKERYSCTKCDKSFTVPFSLRRHMIVHDEPAFVCQQCDRRFRTKETLTRHEPIHSGNVLLNQKYILNSTKVSNETRIHSQLNSHLFSKRITVKVSESQSALPHHSFNNGNTNVIAQETTSKTSQTQATLNSDGPPVVRDDQFRKQNNVTQCVTLSNTTGRTVSKSSSIGKEVDSNLVGGRKQQPEAFSNEPVGTTQKILILFSVGPNPNNCILGPRPSVEPDSSDQLQIAFQQIMDELAKSGSSTVDRSNP